MGVLDEEHKELMKRIKGIIVKNEIKEKLLDVLKPHFEKEEEFVMPLLNSLQKFAEENHNLTKEQIERLAKCYENLKNNYDIIKREHVIIAEISKELYNNKYAKEPIENLLHHAKVEEEILYPAALILGKYITEYLLKHNST